MAPRSSSRIAALAVAAGAGLALNQLCFVPAPEAAASRREVLSLGAASTFGAGPALAEMPDAAERAAARAALAAQDPKDTRSGDFLGGVFSVPLPEVAGPFEVDPKEAVLVGDVNAPESKKAVKGLTGQLEEAKKVLASLEADPQADISFFVSADGDGLADLRFGSNTINNLMDEATAAGTQRLQRLCNQYRYLVEEDAPFPVSKKGKVQPRGPERLRRLKKNLEKYIKYSTDLLEFVA